MTGRWPLQIDTQWKYNLDTPDPTLAEFLASRGYQTVGIVANTNCCNYETGLDRGFLRYEDYSLTPRSLLSRTVPGKWLLEQTLSFVDNYERKWVSLQSKGAREINESFLGWLNQRRSDRPFFAFLNYFDAHEPFIPPSGYEHRFDIGPVTRRDYQYLVDYVGLIKSQISEHDLMMARDSYEDCVAFLDEQLGKLLDELERRQLLEDTVVIITSDHGEAFGEHGSFGHSYTVFVEEVTVPLVILAPQAPAGRLAFDPVSLRDLPATVVDLLGLSQDSPFPGQSLTASWTTSSRPELSSRTSPAFSEQADLRAFQVDARADRRRDGFQMSLMMEDGYQFLRNGQGEEAIFNLLDDPLTHNNLIGTPEGHEIQDRGRRQLLEFLTKNKGSATVEKAYLGSFRQTLADLIRARPPRTVVTP